jgi:hypothetical protein
MKGGWRGRELREREKEKPFSNFGIHLHAMHYDRSEYTTISVFLMNYHGWSSLTGVTGVVGVVGMAGVTYVAGLTRVAGLTDLTGVVGVVGVVWMVGAVLAAAPACCCSSWVRSHIL